MKNYQNYEPMDIQTIEVAAMQAALASDLMDQNLQIFQALYTEQLLRPRRSLFSEL